MIGRFVTFLLAASLIVVAPGANARSALVPPEAGSLAESAKALTAPEMEGRRSGMSGGDLAAQKIADWLAAAGLRPGGDQGSFLQSFVLETAARPGPASSLDLLGPTPRRLEAGREWTAHGGSLAGEVGAELVCSCASSDCGRCCGPGYSTGGGGSVTTKCWSNTFRVSG